MSKNEEMLRQALEELAREETEELESSLTRTEIRKAEEMYQHHRRKAFSLIRRGTGASSPILRYGAIAAAVAVIIGAAVLSLNHTPPDNTPAVQPPIVSVAPYYSPEPAPVEIIKSPEPAEKEEKWEYTATPEPIIEGSEDAITTIEIQSADIPDHIPTYSEAPETTPAPVDTPAPTATFTPTNTPAPTASPAPAETMAPESAAGLAVPPEWQGGYFPYGLPAGGTADVTGGDGWQRIAWHADGGLWVFTEYDENDVIGVPDGELVSYIQWDGIVALRMEDDAGVTLTWVQDGRSFSLRTDAENAEEMAQSVRKTAEGQP